MGHVVAPLGRVGHRQRSQRRKNARKLRPLPLPSALTPTAFVSRPWATAERVGDGGAATRGRLARSNDRGRSVCSGTQADTSGSELLCQQVAGSTPVTRARSGKRTTPAGLLAGSRVRRGWLTAAAVVQPPSCLSAAGAASRWSPLSLPACTPSTPTRPMPTDALGATQGRDGGLVALDWAGSAGERPTYARYPPPILAVVTTSRRHGGRSVPDEYRNTLALLAMLRRHERPHRGFSPPTLVSSRAAPLFSILPASRLRRPRPAFNVSLPCLCWDKPRSWRGRAAEGRGSRCVPRLASAPEIQGWRPSWVLAKGQACS